MNKNKFFKLTLFLLLSIPTFQVSAYDYQKGGFSIDPPPETRKLKLPLVLICWSTYAILKERSLSIVTVKIEVMKANPITVTANG